MDMQCIFPFEGGMHLLMACFASIGHLRGEAGLRELFFESDVSVFGSVKQNLSGKSFLNFVMWLFHSLPLPHHTVGWSAVCVCGSSWSYLLLNLHFLYSSWKWCGKNKTLSLIMYIIIRMSSKSIPDYEPDTEMKRSL